MNNLALPVNIYDIIEEYIEKSNSLNGEFLKICEEINKFKTRCTIMGTYVGGLKHDFERNSIEDILENLKKSAWRYLYNTLKIEHIAPQTHLKHFETLLQDPPEFNAENIRDIFKEYVTDARAMQLQAFAEVFCNLDRYYKSHSNIRIGVKGLPKRVIVSGCNGWSGFGYSKVADIVNALMRFRGQPEKCVKDWHLKELCDKGYFERNDIKHEAPYEGLTFKWFNNGNCHIVFDKWALQDINLALNEYYGDVLPDAYEHNEKKEESTEVAKDLQFYRTPQKAADFVVNRSGIYHSKNILEPSCGDGALMNSIKKAMRKDAKLFGVEVDKDRSCAARESGHNVICANFLEWDSLNKFDCIIMNPPFYGQHYFKHIKKAFSLLEDGGVIHCILPVTAKDNHGLVDKEFSNVNWLDLPVGSFRESGTNINTVLCTIRKKGN